MIHTNFFRYSTLAFLLAYGLNSHAESASNVTIKKYTIEPTPSFYVPYTGPSAAVRQIFPQGFAPAVGSGLAFKNRRADGSLVFLGITDRGPNADGPEVMQNDDKTMSSKIFPAANFTPLIATIVVNANQAKIESVLPIKNPNGQVISGRPLQKGIGATGEVAVDDNLTALPYDENGLDTESLVIDGQNLWTSDEYGPFIVKMDTTGKILHRYAPGNGKADLPMVLAKRRANRGMEGLSLEPISGVLHGFIQSPLNGGKIDMPSTNKSVKVQDFAKFVRWLAFDPKTETSKLYAYPIEANDYKGGKTGNAKLGDLLALGSNRFITIEQGTGSDGKVFNALMLVEIPKNASEITTIGVDLEKSSIIGASVDGADYSKITPLKKNMLLNLNQAGWVAEKAEGLTLADDKTIALINDTDFGVRTAVLDSNGVELAKADITECKANSKGTLQDECANQQVRVVKGAVTESTQNLWLLEFPKPLKDYQP